MASSVRTLAVRALCTAALAVLLPDVAGPATLYLYDANGNQVAALDDQGVSWCRDASNATTAQSASTASTVVDGAITSAKIGDGAVTNAKLADAAATTTKLADLAITSPKIADGAVTTSKIAIEPWHVVGAAGEPPFQNSWVNNGATYGEPSSRFRKVGGLVEVQLMVRGGTPGTIIFTLPAGYRTSGGAINFVGDNGAVGSIASVNALGEVKVIVSQFGGTYGDGYYRFVMNFFADQ